MLVTQSQASKISNVIAVALTLACPRLWILLKEGIPYILNLFRQLSSRRMFHARTPRHGFRWAWCRNDILRTAEESHSELGAATALANIAMHELGRHRMELPATNDCGLVTQQGKIWSLFGLFSRFWDNFLKRPLDVIVPIVLSLLFIGIFVA